MASSLGLGFPEFPGLPNFSFRGSSSFPLLATAALAAASALGLSLAFSSFTHFVHQENVSHIGWASLSLANASCSPVERKTGEVFPEEVDGGRRLLGVGVRRANVLGLKSIDVYAFGETPHQCTIQLLQKLSTCMKCDQSPQLLPELETPISWAYADDRDIKKLNEKYGATSLSELKDKKEFIADALESDIPMTVRLQIVYGRLGIRSVRNSFAKSVGTRLQKFSASEPSDTDQLLQKFVSLFKDEQKLPKGSVIELSREEGYVLRARIDGNEVGQIQSKLLCKSILDLYFGEDPLDKSAKEEIQLNLASQLKTA